MVFVEPAADFVDLRQLPLDGVGNAVLGHHVVERAGEAALGARPVVAGDIDDQRIVAIGQRCTASSRRPT